MNKKLSKSNITLHQLHSQENPYLPTDYKLKFDPVARLKKDIYEQLKKDYSNVPDFSFDVHYSYGYLRAVFDYGFLTKEQHNELHVIIFKREKMKP